MLWRVLLLGHREHLSIEVLGGRLGARNSRLLKRDNCSASGRHTRLRTICPKSRLGASYSRIFTVPLINISGGR